MQGCEQAECVREPGSLVEVESIDLLEAVEHDLSVGSSGAIVDLEANDLQQLACDSTHTGDIHKKTKTGRCNRELEGVQCVATEGDTHGDTPKEQEVLTKRRGACSKEDYKESTRLVSCVDAPWSSASDEDMTDRPGGGMDAVIQVTRCSCHIVGGVWLQGFATDASHYCDRFY